MSCSWGGWTKKEEGSIRHDLSDGTGRPVREGPPSSPPHCPSSHLHQSTPGGSLMHGPHKVSGGGDPERVVPQGECLQCKVLTQHLRGGRGEEMSPVRGSSGGGVEGRSRETGMGVGLTSPSTMHVSAPRPLPLRSTTTRLVLPTIA